MLSVERCRFSIDGSYDDVEAAPLLCASLIDYRSLRMAADDEIAGLYGFGAAAHVAAQVARYRQGDEDAITVALELGGEWAGASTEAPAAQLDEAIIFAKGQTTRFLGSASPCKGSRNGTLKRIGMNLVLGVLAGLAPVRSEHTA